MALFQQHHISNMLSIERFALYLNSIKIHTTRDFDALTICRIPPNVMEAGRHVLD